MEPLNISHYKRIEELLGSSSPETCELAWPSLFAWRHGRRMCVVQVKDSLVLVVPYGDDLTLFGPPLGSISIPEAINEVQKTTGNLVFACDRIPERLVHEFSDFSEWQSFEDRDHFDYVYRCKDLAELSGRKYHKKRNLIAQCLKEYDCAYESFSTDLVSSIREMQSRWCKVHKCGKTPGLCQEYLAIGELLSHADNFDIIGGAVRIDGIVQAYSLGSRLNENTAVIHFEKAMPEFKGLYQLISQWVCQHELGGFEFINREQDIGIEGLRRAKESYFPDHMVTKLILLNGVPLEKYREKRIRDLRCES